MCSQVLALSVRGDFISYSTPFNKMSAVLLSPFGINSTRYPARANISATRSSCVQGCTPAGMMIWPFLFFAMGFIVTKLLRFSKRNRLISSP